MKIKRWTRGLAALLSIALAASPGAAIPLQAALMVRSSTTPHLTEHRCSEDALIFRLLWVHPITLYKHFRMEERGALDNAARALNQSTRSRVLDFIFDDHGSSLLAFGPLIAVAGGLSWILHRWLSQMNGQQMILSMMGPKRLAGQSALIKLASQAALLPRNDRRRSAIAHQLIEQLPRLNDLENHQELFDHLLYALAVLNDPQTSHPLSDYLMQAFVQRDVEYAALERLWQVLRQLDQPEDINRILQEAARDSSQHLLRLLLDSEEIESSPRQTTFMDDDIEAILGRDEDPELASIDEFQDNPALFHRAVEAAALREGFILERHGLGAGPSFYVLLRQSEQGAHFNELNIMGILVVHVSDSKTAREIQIVEIHPSMKTSDKITAGFALMYRWIGTEPQLIERFGGWPVTGAPVEYDSLNRWYQQGLYVPGFKPYERYTHDLRFDETQVDLYLPIGTFPTWPGARSSKQMIAKQQALLKTALENQLRIRRLSEMVREFSAHIGPHTSSHSMGLDPFETMIYRMTNDNGEKLWVSIRPNGLNEVSFANGGRLAAISIPDSEQETLFGPILRFVTHQSALPYREVEPGTFQGSLLSRGSDIRVRFLIPRAALQSGRVETSDVITIGEAPAVLGDTAAVLTRRLQLYNRLRRERETLMEPLSSSLGVFDGHGMVSVLSNVPQVQGIVAGLHADTLENNYSPYAAVFYLRHALDRRSASHPYWDVAMRDVEFLRLLRQEIPFDGPVGYKQLCLDLTRLTQQWNGNAGYMDFLQNAVGEDHEANRRMLFANYLANGLLTHEIQPVWGVTLTPEVYDRLLPQALDAGISAALAQWERSSFCLEATLTRAGIQDPRERDAFRALFQNSGGKFIWSFIDSQKLTAFIAFISNHPEQSAWHGHVYRVSQAANTLWSQLNGSSGTGDSENHEFFLQQLASALREVLRRDSRPSAASLLSAEQEIEFMRERLVQAFLFERENQLLNRDLSYYLSLNPILAADVGLVLAGLIRQNPLLLNRVREFISRFGHGKTRESITQILTQTLSASRLVDDVVKVVTEVRQISELNGRALTTPEFNRLKWAAIQSVRAHEGHTRKDGRAYLVHPLGVILRQARIFHETRLVAFIAGLWHDTKEDRPLSFAEIVKEVRYILGPYAETAAVVKHPSAYHDSEIEARPEATITPGAELSKVPLFIAVVTYVPQPGKSELESMAHYYAGIRDPKEIYPNEPGVAALTAEDIHAIHRLKLADNSENWFDLNFFLTDHLSDAVLLALPSRTFRKSLDYTIPMLVNYKYAPGERVLLASDVEGYYASLTSDLLRYINDFDVDRFPAARTLRGDAIRVLWELETAVRTNYYFQTSKDLQTTAEKLRLQQENLRNPPSPTSATALQNDIGATRKTLSAA